MKKTTLVLATLALLLFILSVASIAAEDVITDKYVCNAMLGEKETTAFSALMPVALHLNTAADMDSNDMTVIMTPMFATREQISKLASEDYVLLTHMPMMIPMGIDKDMSKKASKKEMNACSMMVGAMRDNPTTKMVYVATTPRDLCQMTMDKLSMGKVVSYDKESIQTMLEDSPMMMPMLLDVAVVDQIVSEKVAMSDKFMQDLMMMGKMMGAEGKMVILVPSVVKTEIMTEMVSDKKAQPVMPQFKSISELYYGF